MKHMHQPTRRSLTIIQSLAIVIFFSLVSSVRAESTTEAYEHFASSFKFFGTKELLYDRSEIYLADPQEMKVYLPLLAEFRARKDSVQDLLPLLKHADPKVRLLAIMALYLKEEPHVLPEIYKLVDDHAKTYPDPPIAEGALKFSGIGPPHEPTTVGEAAASVISFYLSAANTFGPVSPNFDTYWAARKDRLFCANWFKVQMLRATQGISPLQEGTIDRIHQLRRKIEAVPAEDRRWILLHLANYEYGQYGTSHLVAEDELTRLCREVGSTTLRKIIRSNYEESGPKRPANAFVLADPDIRPADLCWFIYHHAPDLLVADDAESVLAAGNPVVASELRPAMAAQWLHASLAKDKDNSFWGRKALVAALWRIVGPAEIDFIVNWYFSEPPERGAFPAARSAFLEDVIAHRRPELRTLLAKIVADPRLAKTGPESTRTLLQIINPWLAKPLVDEQELNDSYGHEESEDDRVPDARFKPLPEWHRKLHDSIAEWKPK